MKKLLAILLTTILVGGIYTGLAYLGDIMPGKDFILFHPFNAILGLAAIFGTTFIIGLIVVAGHLLYLTIKDLIEELWKKH